MSFRSKSAEDEMQEFADRLHALVETSAEDRVDFICAPSRTTILVAAARERMRRYSDEYEFGCLTGSRLHSRTPKFG